ncbi:HD domain-containing protein [Paracoccus thiocyanatus]|uniref:HD domain-containing protein n=1 Tax=Paracoccus thiocyanatus TaxID=34006 RepID=A0A1N6QEK3_9RHOB|nr:phosphohydrolase [Paracoccus thiocyanatus]SIQ15033.1 HD domain-containing protein [Paracoccus thiocyanatus]
MNDMDLEQAISIAAQAHRGQRDRAGRPYILHPLRMMLAADGDDQRIVAVLHDVVEDSDWTIDQLRAAGLDLRLAQAVDALTRRKDEDYFDFVDRAGRNVLARAVKILDLCDNSDTARLKNAGPEDQERLEKYGKAMRRLAQSQPPPPERCH